ncbi:methylated-DNA--cysteine S-methyltransferase [Exophiala viscosa]|uniref:Methylated-DNA--protein-cysteine methyltransferase n=1 Tax=Exophiala viscosa TaxID=2486360 RepID=A0AAN6DMF5_9EURO|nr:methylated-DNA--cysteine S-methyltransferase [Exophiala viscosa]KAI1620868.1 methylated-DNA--cysteine S-methyltransferase [Exophiala viscosa]
MSAHEDLRAEWKTLYSETLPALARSRDPAQPKWPVTLDHCFARIILDNTVGKGQQQWDKVIAKPAVRNMDEQQLRDAIDLGMHIIAGKANLCHLDELSLQCRGKNEGKYASNNSGQSNPKEDIPARTREKRSVEESTKIESPAKKRLKQNKNQSTLQFEPTVIAPEKTPATNNALQVEDREQLQMTLHRIQGHATLTAYRKKLYTVLLSVPRGRYTTYAAMSNYLNSSARAVGSGMRNNPFAPDVPCHRVLAASGEIGGFNGQWGKEGKYANKKIELLRNEGVMFDPKGRVVGEPFRKFHTFEDMPRVASYPD